MGGEPHDLGAPPNTSVTILSVGADGERNLGEAASTGPTRHVLDWFDLSIQHVAQTVRAWPNTTDQDRQEGGRLADVVDQHIRWRLCHGQVPRALDLIGDTLGPLDSIARLKSPVAAVTGKVAKTLRALETYVPGQAELIIDYAAARHRDEPI